MANLRIISIVVNDSSNITATFTENLNEDISVDNVNITSQTTGVPNANVLAVNVAGNILQITTAPLTPFAAYFIAFVSIPTQLFNSINGDAVISNDNVSNRQLIIGAMSSDNPVQNYMINFLRQNVYNLESPSVISTYIQSLATILSKSLYDIRQTKNENYLSNTIIDEAKTRGPGPFDRLDEEGAYEVLRVGLMPTAANATNSTIINLFPSYPVSLLAMNNSEQLTLSSSDKSQTFNLNDFTLNLTKSNVIILTSVVFIYNQILSPYIYDISKYGYQILNSEYDPNFASNYLQLNSNQIKLNDKILSDPLFSTNNIDHIQVSYQYKNTGKIIDQNTLLLDSVISSGREVVPPIENVFTLKHAPIVSSNDTIGTIGSVNFIDPNALPGSNTKHPAFLYEVPFRFEYLPSVPGEYSIDYNLGNVYVYGSSSSKDGTGPYPPIAVYYYRYDFKSEIDFVYDNDASDLIALPLGNMLNAATNIYYNYEQVLEQGIDYNADTHIEVLSENIENRLLALNVIQPLNFPITDVFRILNQTTGEIYKTIRWNDNKIFFNYNKAPNITDELGERVSFQNVLNEILFVNQTNVSGSYTIFKILLNNNNIIASTEDCIGSSINTSVNFSNTNIFIQERYFDNSLTETINNSILTVVGDYQIDYKNGIVWILMPESSSYSVGSISYKRGYINPTNPRIITVDDIYYQFSVLSQKLKHFDYINFSNGSILPSSFDISNESYLMGNSTLPYVLLNSQVGVFANGGFSAGITSSVKFIRSIYEHEDLTNNITAINFASSTTSNGILVSVAPLTFTEYHNIQFDGTNYYILTNTNLNYSSPNINLAISAIRLSDSAQLWNSSGTIVFGTPFKLILPGIHSPIAGQAILLTYTYTIQDASRIVIDYNRGDYFIDYSYLVDEIIISYEYGDNVLDFRNSLALNEGDNYYVSYKVGALRDALLANFGTLINIPILNDLDVSFERERYRDALMAALQSFTTGPTIGSISNIVNTIVHTPPKITESAFTSWSIGNSLLSPQPISTTGSFQLVPAVYDNGVVIDTAGQTIKFPTVSNLKLDQGSLETYIIPQWNGIDNQSDLTITIFKNNQLLPVESIFIGPGAFHPTSSTFTINTKDKVLGIPNKSKDGVFIYYTSDPSNLFNRWYIDVIDGYNDGYAVKNYKMVLSTDGKFYDVKSINNSLPASDSITSGTNSLTYAINNISQISTGITFIADKHHYIFDFGAKGNNSRFSLFKDESGFLNFSIKDKYKNIYSVSADVSNWIAGEQHQVAISWALNTTNARDEMHLFIDGIETPNIITYGNAIAAYPHEKFRTIDPEEFVGIITSAIVSSTDLKTTYGSNTVSSSINFSAAGVVNGGTLYIEEAGFNINGYTITNVNGQTLTVSSTLPMTGNNLTYSVNKTSFNTLTAIDLYPNITVSLLHSTTTGNDLSAMMNATVITTTSTNFITLNVIPGFVIVIENIPYTILTVAAHSLTLSNTIPANLTNVQFFLYPNNEEEIPGVNALHPAYSISRAEDGNPSLTIRDAEINDIVLIRTLGLNTKLINKKYYLWNGIGNSNPINTIMTRLPAPATLLDVEINHILLDGYIIGPSSATLSAGIFTSVRIPTDQPSLSDNGRTLSVYISGGNVDYSTPVNVIINGTINGVAGQNETITFTENTTLSTTSKFSFINYIVVNCKPIDATKNCLVVAVREFYPITFAENSNIVPTIRYSYQMLNGTNLSGTGGNTLTDSNVLFSVVDIGNYIIIKSPAPVAGQYLITGVSADRHSITIANSITSFTNGNYQVLNTTTFRSGLQNGFFTFEQSPGVPYNLVQGLYDFKYHSYLSINIDLEKCFCYIGSDINGNNILNGIVDEFQIVSQKLTDIRIGETAQANQETITTDFNSLKALKPNINTLVLLHFDTFPFENAASIYTTADKKYIQSDVSVNSNFGQSIVLKNSPLIIDNNGILNSKNEGTIEFWVSPLIDTANDPNYRYYFDATSLVSESAVSINNATVKVVGKISSILSVRTVVGDQKINYSAGGKVDIDNQTIYLDKALPNQQTPVIVEYIPLGTNGDRISIYKDSSGYINFNVYASQINYTIRAPIYWTAGTWHRLKAMYKFNSGLGNDTIRFFIDGYERGDVVFGAGVFGTGQTFGSSFIGQNGFTANIVFSDMLNELFIGSDFTSKNNAFILIDNLRISDISRQLFLPFGESIDVNYSSNTDVVFPVASDLFTTLLMDFDTLAVLNTNFAILKNKTSGLFDFSVEIFDSFDIIQSNPKVKQILETLLNILKPASSTIYIKYFEGN